MIIILIFPRKQDLTFHANIVSIGDNWHEMSKLVLREK